MRFFLLTAMLVGGVAGILDWRKGEIPNWLSVGTLVLGVVGHWMVGSTTDFVAGLQEAAWAIAGAFVCGVVPFLFWRQGAFGGGDVKMLAAIGAMLLPMLGIEAELYSLIAAAVFAPARLAWEGRLLHTLGNTVAIVMNPLLPKERRRALSPEMLTSMRFGPAIFAGVVACAIGHWRGLT